MATDFVLADILSTKVVSGDVYEILPPNSVRLGEKGLENNTHAFLFQEKSNFTLVKDLSLNINQGGKYGDGGTNQLTGGEILQGTSVNSYFLQVDPIGEPRNPNNAIQTEGTIAFAEKILGLVTRDRKLFTNIKALELPEERYVVFEEGEDKDNGLELDRADSITWNTVANTISFSYNTRPSSDQVRIITEAVPTISVDDVMVDEDAGEAIFTVSLSKSNFFTHEVSYITSDGSAKAGSDYTFTQGELKFNPNDPVLTRKVSVPINHDSITEVKESFFLNISNPTGGAIISDSQGEGSIKDVPIPRNTASLSLSGSSFSEAGGQATVTANLDRAADQPVTINLGFGGTTDLGQDYTPSASSIYIAAGASTGSITLNAIDDSIVEPNETVVVDINSISGGPIENGTQRVQGLITDNDIATISISDGMVLEGDGGTTNLRFTITTDTLSSQPITGFISTSDITATAGDDYFPLENIPFEIPANTLFTQIEVPVNGDTVGEDNETFQATISNASINGDSSKVNIGDPIGIGTIKDNDLPIVTLTIDPDGIAEAGGIATLTATLDRSSSTDVTVDLAASGEATLETDYTLSSNTIVIPAGQLSSSTDINGTEVTIAAIDDNIVEVDENVVVEIASVTGAREVTEQVVETTILDPEDVATLSLSDATLAEGDDGTTNFVFTLTTDTAAQNDIAANIFTTDLTAIGGEDFTPLSNFPVVIPAGEFSTTFSIEVTGDTNIEANETFVVAVTQASIDNDVSRVAMADPFGFGTILNDDAPNIALTADVDSMAENGGQAVITVSLDEPGLEDVAVTLNFAGDATFGVDYNTKSTGTIFIPAGATTGSTTVTLAPWDDAIDELDEAIEVSIASATNADWISTLPVTVTIIDDDIAGITLTETDGSTVVVEGGAADPYTLVLDSQPTSDVVITLASDSQIALDQSTITFTPDNWDSPQTIGVTALADGLLEDPHPNSLISHAVSSIDPNYDGVAIPDVDVAIADVTITERNVLFVADTDMTRRNVTDQQIMERLTLNLGGTDVVNLTTLDDDVIKTEGAGDISGYDLIVISETVHSGKVDEFAQSLVGESVGVLTWEAYLYDDLGMTGTQARQDYGFAAGQELDITNSGHSLASGLSDTVSVYDDSPDNHISWGRVSSAADVIATVPGTDQAAIFAYEAGDVMVGATATGKRVGLFLHGKNDEFTHLTDEGLALFDAAVDYMVS